MRNSNRLHGLLLLGVTFIAYGLGLTFGYVPHLQNIRYLTFGETGWAFLIVGTIMFLSLTSQYDGWLYSLAALFSAAWATVLTVTAAGTNGWASAVAWWCLACVCILLAGWPDPPEPKNIPPAPKLEEKDNGP